MKATAKTLSVIVPVRNAERTLTPWIIDLLEVLGDLDSRFEVLIVDDGSTDQTDEVAYDLSNQYPQVGVTRHAKPQGIESSVETGVAGATGEVVLVHTTRTPVNAQALRRLWQHREEGRFVVSPSDTRPGLVDTDLLEALQDWAERLAGEVGTTVKPPARRAKRSNPHARPQPSIPTAFFKTSDGTMSQLLAH